MTSNHQFQRVMNQRGALEFFRNCFIGFSALALAALMTSAVGRGDLSSSGMAMLFVFSSYPLGGLGFVVVSESFLESIANPISRAFVMWAPFFVLGWIQWTFVFPGIRWLIQRARRSRSAV